MPHYFLKRAFVYLATYRPFRVAAEIFVIAALIIGYWWFILMQSNTDISVVFAGHSEYVSYKVVRQDFAKLRIAGMTASGAIRGCVDAVVTPREGTNVEYRRGDNTYFRIILDPSIDQIARGQPAFVLSPMNGVEQREIKNSTVFEASSTCPGDLPTRLPLWGAAHFGDILTPAGEDGRIVPGELIDGTISVYARAQDKFVVFALPTSIYLANSFALAPGSTLSEPLGSKCEKENDSFRTESEPRIWRGSARVKADSPGFIIEASREIEAASKARSLCLRGAGSTGTSGGDQLIDFGNYAQYLKDPNIINIQFIVAALLFLVQAFLGIMAFLESYLFGGAQSRKDP